MSKTAGAKTATAVLARGMSPIGLEECRRQGGNGDAREIAGRDLTSKVIELEAFAHALHSSVPAGDLVVILFCDMARAFTKVSQPWVHEVLRLQGMPVAARRGVSATSWGLQLMICWAGLSP